GLTKTEERWGRQWPPPPQTDGNSLLLQGLQRSQPTAPGERSVHLGQLAETPGDLLIRGNIVAHFSVMESLIGIEIEVAGAGEAEKDRFLLAGLLAPERFVDCHFNGVAGLGGGQ